MIYTKQSFENWCYDNLSIEVTNDILSRWDYDLNIDKKGILLTPKDVGFSSHGFNNKGYWFKCLEYPEHASEQKSINDFTRGKCGMNCTQCRNIQRKERLSGKIPISCPDCGFVKEINPSTIKSQGFGCPRCSDGISYPEKFMFNVLDQLNINFIYQLTRNTFKWCKKYKYDFYIEQINCIIETHGKQHYEDDDVIHWKTSVKKIKENDKHKEILSKNNKIENYIVINCKNSNMGWIKNNIMESKLPKLLNFKEKDIDWIKCDQYSRTSVVKTVCGLWGETRNTLVLANKIKLNRGTVIRYLKQGTELGWCDYDPEEEKEKAYVITSETNQKKVKKTICLTTKEIFDSLKEACKKYDNISQNSISKCCTHTIQYAGKHPETGEKMVWMYYDEFVIKNQVSGWYDDYINNYINDDKIICVNTKEIFNSQKEAINKYNIKGKSSISACCRNRRKSAGVHPNTGEQLQWMYYKDYLKYKEKN